MKRIDLRKQYTEEIQGWAWESAKNQCQEDEEVEEPEFEGDSRVGRAYLGTVMNTYPSGKFYMFWCTNQTWRDVVMDSLYGEILEEEAEKHDMWVEGGEGDPCDLFLCMALEETE